MRMAGTGHALPEADEPAPRSRVLQSTETDDRRAHEPARRLVPQQRSRRDQAAVAVFVAQRLGVQHGFWVVLGTLSVLRSNALGTGWSIVQALAGTAVGIVSARLS